MKFLTVTPRIVESAPQQLEPGVFYISEKYATALHLCCCGCGYEVVTPLSSAEWQLHWTGDTVSLYPSVGNGSFACKSHYWIRKSRVIWAEVMSESQIARVRQRDQRDKARQIRQLNARKFGANRIGKVWGLVKTWLGR